MNEDGHFTKKANTLLFQVFGQILEQSQAIMSQMIAKNEGTMVRIHRKGVSYIKLPFLEISTLNSKLSRPQKRILKAAKQLCEK